MLLGLYSAGGKSTPLVSSEKAWSEASLCSQGEVKGAREREERGRGREAAFPKGRERVREIITVVKRRLKLKTARGRRVWSKTVSEVFLLAGARRGDYIQVCYAS